MNWKKEAINLLKDYPAKKDSLENLKERYAMLELESQSLRAAQTTSIPLKGGLSRQQEHLINSLAEKEQLQANYRFTKQQLNWVEKGLSQLAEDERLVLMGFYANDDSYSKNDLMDQLCIERSALYELKEKALRKFTLTMYGLLES